MEDDKELLEKLKINIALSNFKDEKNKQTTLCKEKWGYNMKKKILAIGAACFIAVSGVALAFNGEKIVNHFRGLGNGIDTAANNGYIENVDMEPIKEETEVQNKEVENVNVGVKIDDFVMDDYNLSVKFSFQFEDGIENVLNLDNLHNIELDDLYILDENNVLIYNMLKEEEFNEVCNKHNLDLEFGEFSDNCLNNGLNSFVSVASQELKLAELQYNMYTDKYPKSKELDFYFTKITFTENDKEEKTTLVGDWHIHLDVPEKFYNRTEEYYKVTSCTNENFNIYTAKVTDTGFEFGMTIDNEKEPEYPEELTKKMTEIHEQYGNGDIPYNSPEYSEEKQEEEMYKLNELLNTSPYKEMREEYYKKAMPILSDGWTFTGDKEGESCYVMNENNEKFECTLSPSRKCSYKFIDGDKYDFYETYSMTKYDATDNITMVINYRGTMEYITLSKIK